MRPDIVEGSHDPYTLLLADGVVDEAKQILVFKTAMLLKSLNYLLEVMTFKLNLFEQEVLLGLFVNEQTVGCLRRLADD